MGARNTFDFTKYVTHIDYLTPIFVNLTESILVNPTLSDEKTTYILKDNSEMVQESLTREEVEEYKIKLKEYLRDEKVAKTVKRLLHNAVWGQGSYMLSRLGQCSHILRTKLKGNKSLLKVKLEGDVIELLKMIRSVRRKMTTNASLYN